MCVVQGNKKLVLLSAIFFARRRINKRAEGVHKRVFVLHEIKSFSIVKQILIAFLEGDRTAKTTSAATDTEIIFFIFLWRE